MQTVPAMNIVIFIIFAILKNITAYTPTCKMIGSTGYTELSNDGDFIIGGLFSLDNSALNSERDFRTPPTMAVCRRWVKITGKDINYSHLSLYEDVSVSLFYFFFCRKNFRELKFARTLIFTLEKINNDTDLLPGVTLGYNILNTCGTENLMRATLEAINGIEKKQECVKVNAFIGHSSSGPTKQINKILSPFGIPQVNNTYNVHIKN